MGEKFDRVFFIDGQEIKSINESEMQFSCEKNTFERECEIKTTHGTIHFTAVFTEEQLEEFLDVYEKSKGGVQK